MAGKAEWLRRAVKHTLRKKSSFFKSRLKYSKKHMVNTGEASERLAGLIRSGKPFMAGRIGFFEQAVMRMYEFKIKKKYALTMKNLYECAGFFPLDLSLGNAFTELMKESVEQTDLYACNNEFLEDYFLDHFLPKDSVICPNMELYDVFKLERPWTAALEVKKVLVVTPFTDSVEHQYSIREKIYPGTDILPEFELKTYRSQMTIGDMNDGGFRDWFEALDFMNNEIAGTDFDIALIGCGAYGFPLAAQIKRSGKMAVCMGGVLQILFGIMGRRWDGSRFGGIEHMPEKLKRYYNDNWIYPLEERPAAADGVEYGPYWK